MICKNRVQTGGECELWGETEVADGEDDAKGEGGVNTFKNKLLSVAGLFFHFLLCYGFLGTARCSVGQAKPQALHKIFILAMRRHEETYTED